MVAEYMKMAIGGYRWSYLPCGTYFLFVDVGEVNHDKIRPFGIEE